MSIQSDNLGGTTDSSMTNEVQVRDSLIRTLETLEAEFGTDFPISSVILMLRIPAKGNVSMSQIVKASRLSGAGASRTLATLAGYSKVNRRLIEKPYLSIVEDPADRRYKFVSYTEYGKAFINRLLSIIN